MTNFMVDIETLGNEPGCVVLSIGAVQFNMAGVYQQFYKRIDIAEAVVIGLTADPSTIKWWKEQSPQAYAAAFYEGVAHSPYEALSELNIFFAGALPKQVWTFGNFDLPILETVYDMLELPTPWSFRDFRDVRTLLSFSLNITRRMASIPHHALDDAVAQAYDVINACKALGLSLK